jgi:hypothetical protein
MGYHLLKISHLSAIVLMALSLGFILRDKKYSKSGTILFFIFSVFALSSGIILIKRWEMIETFGLWMQLKTLIFIFLLFVPWIHLRKEIPRTLISLVFLGYMMAIFLSTTKIY